VRDVLQIEIETDNLINESFEVDDFHAAIPKSVWMNWRWPTTSPLGSHQI
jgi:hypothetical protein